MYKYDSISAENLYNKVLINTSSMYVSPKDVISKVENGLISINGVVFASDQKIYVSMLGMKQYISLNYTIAIKIKDGKVRIDIPSLNKIGDDMPLTGSRNGTSGIFKKDGKVRFATAKEGIETYINNLVKTLIKGINNNDW